MALISEFSVCVLCNQPLNRPYIATQDGPRTLSLRLYDFADAPMHIDCIAQWPDRVEFSRGFFTYYNQSYIDGPGYLLISHEDWILVTGPTGPHIRPNMAADDAKIMLGIGGLSADTDDPFYAEVITANWPLGLYSGWLQWNTFISDGYKRGLDGEALAEANRVIEEVRRYAPNLQAMRKLLADHQRKDANLTHK